MLHVDHVRFGSKADIRAAKSHVRFTPESGHVRCSSRCPLWAKGGHLQLIDHLKYPCLGIDFHLGAIGDSRRDVVVKTCEHWHVRERSALCKNRIYRIEYKGQWHSTSRSHFMQHPCRRNAALSSVENQNLVDIRLTGKLMCWPRKYAGNPIKVITRRKAVARYERSSSNDTSHRVTCKKFSFIHRSCQPAAFRSVDAGFHRGQQRSVSIAA